MNTHAPRFAASARAAFLGSAALACMASPAMAQNAATQDARQVAEDYGNEIVVTATKREQTLQDVPVAVSVTTAETIERAQIRDIKDLTSVVPSLRVTQLQSSANTNFFIRGFGNGANNVGIEPSVGLFIDGVYRSRSAAMIGDLPDVSRVEVLRGPQSTLFGKNASAGVISFVTREPQFTTGGNFEATYGNYNAITAKGVVTGPMNDVVALSLAGGINLRDGYVRDRGPAGGRTNERNRWFGRAQVLMEPSKDLKMRFIADYSKINEKCCAVVNLVSAAPTAIIKAPPINGQVNLPADRFKDVVFNNLPSTNKVEAYGLSHQIDYSFSDLKLTSITAWRKTYNENNQDSDFTSGDLLARNYGKSGIRTFTQELRLASDFDGPLNFLVGAFYFDENIKQRNELYLGKDFRPYANGLITALSGGAFTLPTVEALLGLAQAGNPGLYAGRSFLQGSGNTEVYRMKNRNYSLFGQVDYELTERLTFTAGINYTNDRKKYATNVSTTEQFSRLVLADFIPGVTNVLIAQGVGTLLNTAAPGSVPTGFASPAQIQAVATGGFGATAQGAYFNVIVPQVNAGVAQLPSLAALQFLPPFVNVPNAVENGIVKDDDFSFTARLAYDVND
ncbi:MAG TPA: TonB-dependent receptor, partial [Novosphingobium sp.]|nr:TonB-dependent receptor [Novosphingobium sp.]